MLLMNALLAQSYSAPTRDDNLCCCCACVSHTCAAGVCILAMNVDMGASIRPHPMTDNLLCCAVPVWFMLLLQVWACCC